MSKQDRVPHPEAMTDPALIDDYIHLSNPGVWTVLILILCFLMGAGLWVVVGQIDVTTPAFLRVERGQSTLWLNEKSAIELKAGDRFEAAGTQGTVVTAAGAPQAVEEVLVNVEDGQVETERLGQWLCPFSVSVNLPAGAYPATVVLERLAPWELVFGGAKEGA